MKRTLIRVTQKHIDHSSHSANTCPVALAISDAIKTSEVSVISQNVMFVESGRAFDRPSSKFSIRATRWIRRYDNRKSVKPFNFYLMVPSCVH